jgi:quercetin dioxygenase-like cupin family protein
VGVGALAPAALASPPSGFTPTLLVKADFDETVRVNSDRIKFRTKDATDVMVQKIVLDPGGSSGWHHHPGIVIIAVKSGSVTVWDSECNQTTYGPGLPNGAVSIERGDEPGQVTSADGATTYTTFIAPSADPPVFRIEDDAPPCARSSTG